jgi:hypothetical protein
MARQELACTVLLDYNPLLMYYDEVNLISVEARNRRTFYVHYALRYPQYLAL